MLMKVENGISGMIRETKKEHMNFVIQYYKDRGNTVIFIKKIL